MNLIQQLQSIPDYRKQKGKRHELWLVLLLILLGAMVGYWGYRPLEDFTRVHRKSLIELLELSPETEFPSYSTFRRVLLNLDFQPLTDVFNGWASISFPPVPTERLAIDGKGICCTLTNYNQSYRNLISVVSVFSHGRGIVMKMQPMSSQGEGEIKVVQKLVKDFRSQNVMFTLDALHCQKKTVEQIKSDGNDYLIGLKQNQPTLYKVAQNISQNQSPISSAAKKSEEHGRSIQRLVQVFTVPEEIQSQWMGLSSFVVVERTGFRKGKRYDERRYYISSQLLSAEQLLMDIQGHWGIENRLHWVRDVTFCEDFPPRRGGNAPVNWAILHNFFISIARSLGYRTIPQAQRCLNNQLQTVFSLLIGNHPPELI